MQTQFHPADSFKKLEHKMTFLNFLPKQKMGETACEQEVCQKHTSSFLQQSIYPCLSPIVIVSHNSLFVKQQYLSFK